MFTALVVLGLATALGAAPPAASTMPATAPASGLVAYYPLDGDAKDACGHARDGRVIGAAPAEDRFGRADHALAFDGADDEVLLDPPSLTSQALTLSLWVQFNLPQQHSIWEDLMDGAGRFRDPIIGQDDGYHIRCYQLWLTEDTRIVWHRMAEFSSAWTNWKVEPDKWYHLVAVFDGSHHRLYVNGRQEHSVPGILKISHDEPLRLGSKGDGSGKRAFFSGVIDDVRIYDRPLSPQEILQLYHQPQP